MFKVIATRRHRIEIAGEVIEIGYHTMRNDRGVTIIDTGRGVAREDVRIFIYSDEFAQFEFHECQLDEDGNYAINLRKDGFSRKTPELPIGYLDGVESAIREAILTWPRKQPIGAPRNLKFVDSGLCDALFPLERWAKK